MDVASQPPANLQIGVPGLHGSSKLNQSAEVFLTVKPLGALSRSRRGAGGRRLVGAAGNVNTPTATLRTQK